MATAKQLKEIMKAAESASLFRSALDAVLAKASADAGVSLTTAERRLFRLSVATIEAEDGSAYEFLHICASKGCKTVKGQKKPKKLITI